MYTKLSLKKNILKFTKLKCDKLISNVIFKTKKNITFLRITASGNEATNQTQESQNW